MDDNIIYIVPLEDKPVKIVYEAELPCPISMYLEETIRCKYAKSKIEDMTFTIYCSVNKCKLNMK